MESFEEICLKKNTILDDTYKITKVISISEISIIYLAINIYTEKVIAIKEFYPKNLALRDIDNLTVVNRLPSTKKKYEDLKKDFHNEILILQQIYHEKIVKYLSHFEENETIYIVMEYYEGITLNEYLKNTPLKDRKNINEILFIPLIDALQYIHKMGIIHRDIKPSNIIIDSNNNVHLLDFGAAVFYKNQKEFKIYTTSGYSPLEQYSKQSIQGVHTDLYSYAATLYYSLTGVLVEDISKRLINEKIKNVRYYNKEVSFLLSFIINWGLAVNFKKRCFSFTVIKIALFIDKWIK